MPDIIKQTDVIQHPLSVMFSQTFDVHLSFINLLQGKVTETAEKNTIYLFNGGYFFTLMIIWFDLLVVTFSPSSHRWFCWSECTGPAGTPARPSSAASAGRRRRRLS